MTASFDWNRKRGDLFKPLLPIEKKLIGWNLGIGVALLIVLAIFNRLVPLS